MPSLTGTPALPAKPALTAPAGHQHHYQHHHHKNDNKNNDNDNDYDYDNKNNDNGRNHNGCIHEVDPAGPSYDQR